MTSYKKLKSKKFSKTKTIGFKIPILTQDYKKLSKMYSKAKYIYLFSDLRAVSFSMNALKFDQETWIEKYGIKEIEKFLQRNCEKNE